MNPFGIFLLPGANDWIPSYLGRPIPYFFENFKATVEGTALPEKEKKGWFKK